VIDGSYPVGGLAVDGTVIFSVHFAKNYGRLVYDFT
jgi:hypothetical protein